MHMAILRLGILLTLATLGTSVATAQTELFFATGVDSTGWAQAQSNADGHVLIESPQYPRGLWLHLVDEAGDALAGIQVEYQGRPDSLVAIHCVDPAGGVRETLFWTRPEGTPLRLALKPKKEDDLSAGFTSIDWQIDLNVESLLEPTEETRLIGWEAVAAFLRERWQDQAGRVAVHLNAGTAFAVEVDNPEALETLMAYLLQLRQSSGTSRGETTPLDVQAFKGGFALREVVTFLIFFEDALLESVVRHALGQPQGIITAPEAASLTELNARHNWEIRNLVGLEHFAGLQRLLLENNQITDVTPLAALNNLEILGLQSNQITDITPLAALSNLQWLALRNNQITNANSLAALNNLTTLELSVNPIADITPLAHLANLEELYLWNNQIADVAPLASLVNLQRLILRENQIVDLNPLIHLTGLKRLSLGYNQIIDLSPLASLTNLPRLSLESNRITNVSPLAHLTNLQELSLQNNQIADLSPLVHLTNLEWLNLRENPFEDISALVDNTGLGEGDTVLLRGNPLSDQARNEQIPALKARGVKILRRLSWE